MIYERFRSFDLKVYGTPFLECILEATSAPIQTTPEDQVLRDPVMDSTGLPGTSQMA